MNICFVSNFSKTYLFNAISKELSKQGFSIYWIATNKNIFEYLKKDCDIKNILLLNKKYVHVENEPIGDFKINELVFGDRMLKNNKASSRDFLINIQKPTYDFIQSNQINYIFGELTWAHEILIHRISTKCKELNCQFLNPHVVRIPNNRFAFFTDEYQSEILEIKNRNQFFWKKLQAQAPYYSKINKNIQKRINSIQGKILRLKKIMHYFKIDKLDPTLENNLFKRIKCFLKKEWNKNQYKKIKFSSFDVIKNKPYVFLGLHKQPEASIDVFGRYYEDQFQNIINIWRALPSGWNLIIKEHSVAIGYNEKSFYKKIQSLPQVLLIDDSTSSYEVIQNSELVVTVTGTMAYEASLKNIPALTLVPTFFNQHFLCQKVSLEDLRNLDLKIIKKNILKKKKNIESFSKFIYKNTFEGNVLDPISDPKVMEDENIKLISKAFGKAMLFSEEIRTIKPCYVAA